MRHTRRQRHKLLLSLLSPIAILLLMQQQVARHCQVEALNSIGAYQYAPSAQLVSSSASSPSKQYHNHNHHNHHQNTQSRSNLLLVNQPISSIGDNIDQHQLLSAQNLPLTRHLADLDNVIESTTLTTSSLSDTISHPHKSILSTQSTTTTTCQLPPTWAGKWYQSNKEPIRVTNTEISDKGLCRDQKGDKYLFEYNGGPGKQSTPPCLICLVINERHLNVLQYKESSCQPIPVNYLNRSSNANGNNNNNLQQVNSLADADHSLLESICSDITGDAQLESLFRLETPPIECPINGQFSFTYDSCREPQSSLNSCIDKKQLNFKFNACPDVPGSESKSEVLKCYADWSEGNYYYMIGRLEQASNQDKGKFRCYVYEKSPDGKITMGQSLEESCYGVNPEEGPRKLRLSVKPPTSQKCFFPSYIQSQSENWLSVDSSLIYMFNQNSTKYQVKETKEGNIIEEATCLQQFTTPFQAMNTNSNPYHQHLNQARNTGSSNNQQQVAGGGRYMAPAMSTYTADQSLHQHQAVTSRSVLNDHVYLVQITKNCYTTNYCVRFYRRSNGIVQIDYFNSSQNNENQCRNAYIETPQTQIITSTNLEHQRCPFEGAYSIEAPIESDLTYNPSNIFICPRQSFLTAQCDHPSRLRIHSKCSPTKMLIKNLYCLGSWTTNGLVRLLLADDDRQRYSAWYRDYGLIPSPQDGVSLGLSARLDLHQAQALQLQQPAGMMTRSQQLLATSANTLTGSPNNHQLMNSLTPIVDLQIALLTPLPIIAKPMQVRLTRRNQCSDLRNYMSQGAYGGPMLSPSIPSYASSATASSAASPTILNINLVALSYYSPGSMLIMIVTLLMPLFTRYP